MNHLRIYPGTHLTLRLIPLQRLAIPPPRVLLNISTYGLCRVNPLPKLPPLCLQQGATTLSLRSLLTTHYIPVVSKTTKKYWKSYNTRTLPGTHYIIVHSSFRRNPPCLLATIPFSRSKPKTLSPQEWSIGSITPF